MVSLRGHGFIFVILAVAAAAASVVVVIATLVTAVAVVLGLTSVLVIGVRKLDGRHIGFKLSIAVWLENLVRDTAENIL